MPVRLRFSLVLVLVAVELASARKPRPVPCSPGTFVLTPADAAQVTSGIGIGIDDVELTGDRRVRIGGCIAKAHVKATKSVTRVTASLKRCGAAKRLKLSGTIASPACDEMQGTLRAARRPKESFTAHRMVATTTTTVIGATTTTTLVSALCGDGTLEAGEACDRDPQCGRRAHCTPLCACEPFAGDVAPTSQVLIDDALRAGQIDLGTSLLYRAYAVFADPRLPAEFDGVGAEPEDAPLFTDIADAWPTLSDAARALLQPFTVRPTDPGSVFSTGAALLRSAAAGDPMSCSTVTPCASWKSSDTTHFRVWSCGDALAATRADVAAEAESLYAPMTSYMGEPVPDDADNDGTPKTDVYIVELNQARLRDGECKPIFGSAAGQAHTAPPRLTNVGSGIRITAAFMLLPVPEATTATGRKSIIAHEFFHVLQLGTSEDATSSWLGESTAVWAEWKFVPETSDVSVHPRFKTYQSRFFLSLDTGHVIGPFSLAYSSYVWWYFAQQESDPSVVAAVWSNAANGAAPNKAANQAFSFADHFRDFIVRNLDDTPLVGASLATYQQAPMDPKFPFPQKVADVETGFVTATQPAGVTMSTNLAYLTEQVFRVDVAADVRKLSFDFTTLPGGANLDVEILLRTTNPPDPAFAVWQRRRPMGGKLTLCRDKGDPQVFEAYVILGNHDWNGGGKIAGTWKVTGGVCGYPRQVGMDFTLSYTIDTPELMSVHTWTGSAAFALDSMLSVPAVGQYYYHLQGGSGTLDIHEALMGSPSCDITGTAPFTVPPSVVGQDNVLQVWRDVFVDPTKAMYRLSMVADDGPITVHSVCGATSSDEERQEPFAFNGPIRDVPWGWPIIDDSPVLEPGDGSRLQVQFSGSDFVADE